MSNLIITGVIDGPLTGGTPKVIELYALNDIADLSIYGIEAATNGSASTGVDFSLTGSATAGNYIYVASETTQFNTYFGFNPTFVNGVANINGDDTIILFENNSIVDVFGEIGVDGTGRPWEHLDGWAYRNNGADPSSTFNASEWTFSGVNALDDDTANVNATATPSWPIGTFSAGGTPTALDLSTYVRIGRYDLPVPARTANPPAGSELALEVSAVTYNPTTDTLFVLGDEGTAIVEIDKKGQLVSSMTLTNGDFGDPEGLTYVGNGQFVLVEERLRQANLFTYTANGTLSRANVQSVILGTTVGNIGLEGASYDPVTSGYIFVKEVDPQGIFQTAINFGAGTATNGSATTANSTNLFDPAKLNVVDIADVFALANSSYVSGTAANNLLVLSQESGKVVEVDRSGNVLSTLTITADAGNPLTVTNHGFEGVTLDNNGLLYLTSESGGGDGEHPQVWVYASAGYNFNNAAPVAVSVANATTTLLENTNTTNAIKLGNIIVSDDSLGTNTLSVSGTGSEKFEIVGNALFLKAGATLDFGTQPNYALTIAVDDSTLGSTPDATTSFNLAITDTQVSASPLIVSEVAPWSSGNSSLGADWFEVTNTGANAIDLTGWKIDDDSASFASGSALSGVTSIAPNQSVIFVDGSTATTTAFINLWFGGTAPNGFAIGTYSGPGLGTGGDAINLFNAAGTFVTGVSFDVSPAATPFTTFENPNGFTAISSLSNLSKSGNNGAFSVIDAGEGVVLTGSPGAIAGTPATPTLVGIVATGATASENNLAPGEFTILRTGDTTAALDVTYSIRGQSGDAVNGTDYNAINATTVTIAAGQSQVKIAIAPIDDAIVESTESIVLTLTDTAAYDVQANVATATVTIEDNDTALPNFNLQITEIWPGNSAGSNLTADWFEITNTGTEAWVAGVTPDLYYDDDSKAPAEADLINGLTQIAPGKAAIVVVGSAADAQTFRTVWGSVINLTNVDVGYTDGAGLGANGDGVSLFVGLPATGAVPVDFEAYPTGSAGKSYDVNLAAFSAAGASGAVATAVNNGGQAAIGSPGNGNPITKISAIQGTGSAAIAGTYTIEGIVVGDFQGTNQLGGFYLQEEDTDADGNVLTSEAIFVNSLTAINGGDKVRVTGVVAENSATPSFNQAIITPTDVSILTTGQQALVTATTVDLPTTVLGDLERYEGMLVTIPETLTVTEVFNLGRFGEVSLSANGRLSNPTNIIDPNDSPASGTSSTGSSNVAAVTAQQDLNNRSRIILDDGSSASNLSDVPYIDTTDTSTLNDTLRVGSTIAGLTGVLGYGFNNYRIQATQAPIFNYEARPALPSVGGSVKVGSFNVLNYFNGDGLGGGFPTSRGADSAAEFSRQRTKIIAAIQALNADVVGLIEMENDGDGANSAIADLVNGLNAAMGAGTYAFVPLANTTGTSGTDEIKVAFIYKPSAVTPVGNAVYFNDSAFNTARPPLAQTFSVNATGEKFISIVNHFKSKGSSAGLTGDTDQGDGQGLSNATRKAQATALLNFVSQMQTASGDSDVMILGDLNAYNEEDPIDILRAGGFTKLTTATESYVFDGQSGSLDHALVSASLLSQVTGAAKWNINSSEPIVFDYNDNIQTTGTNGEQTSELRNDTSLYSANPFRSSDHDPVLVGLNLISAKVTIAQSGGTTNVTEGGATDTYTVVLDRQPTANVTIAINAGTQLNTSSNSLTFTSANWNVAQTVTVTAIDDATFEGTHNGTIAHVATSNDASYNGLAIGSVTASITDNEVPIVTLKGFASLPADTFSEGPKSGAAVTTPTNGRPIPFSGQPVQGFSGVQFAPGGDGSVFWFLADNGFGAKGNSADFLLRLYQVNPNFAGTENGDRSVSVQSFIQLSDPNKLIPFDIVNKSSAKRELTGADFDPESFVIDAKGDIWVGDEFGTYLLHFDRNGVLLDAPIATPNSVKLNTLNGQAPIVIGHRGASGELPEHTIEAYRLAILRGADFIEPDLVSTKDGILIARHEPILGSTTDVASRPEFASRNRSGVIDGVTYNNEFFASDFTLAEIKTLRAVMPQGYRDKIYDGVLEIPTFAEVIDLVKEVEAQTGKKIGIYPETKHPTFHDNLSLSLEEKVIDTLKAKNFTDPKRVFIQSFEVSNLKDLNSNIMPAAGVNIPLVQLFDAYDVDYNTGALVYKDEYARPYDFTVANDPRTYGDLQTPAELAKIAEYAEGIGPWKRMIVSVKNVDADNNGQADDLNKDGTINDADRVTLAPSSLINDAHAKGLFVHTYTFRNESGFLASDYKNNPEAEYRQFINLGVDGYFTDFPGTGDVVRDQMTGSEVRSPQNPTVLSTPKFNTIDGKAPIVIGHRGASGDRPEHTLAAYKLAIAQGADFIEPDLVVTKDGVLVARHEPMLAVAVLNTNGSIQLDANGKPVINNTDTSTDVYLRDKFADRLKIKNLDGRNVAGWFVEDFTLAEVKELNAIERIPALRGTEFDNDKLKVPTLAEVIQLVKEVEAQTGRKIGIYPETKHPTFFQQQGINTSQLLVDTLKATNFTDPSRVFIQSFEVSNLKALKSTIMPTAGINIPLVQLFGGSGQPYDFVVSGDTRTYTDLSTTSGLAEIATYAKGIGPNKQRIIPQLTVDANNNGQPDDLNGDGQISDGDRVLGTPTTLIADAHKAGLIVHLYTLRNESFFLPSTYNGDPAAEYRKFIDLGVDGFFTDFPRTGRSVLVNDYFKGTGYTSSTANFTATSPVGFDPNNPYYGDLVTANLGGSRGFEGMAFSPDRQTLYPLLEGTVVGDPDGSLRIYKFDVTTKTFQGLVGRYQLANPLNAIGDFTPVNNNEFLIIERDNGQGSTAAFKKIFKVDFSKIDANGFVSKEEVANLLNIKDTNDLNGDGSTTYTMPFQTIEDVLVLDSKTILVANDNNYPFSIGRPTAIDNNEIVVLELEKPLALDSRLGVAAAVAEAPSLKSGTANNDNFSVVSGIDGINDTIFTGAGDDKVDTVLGVNSAFAGNNRVDLGSGNDSIFVNTGDRAFGGDGNDTFDARDGKGGNRMSGGAGDDKFFLGFGDRALGGDGKDEFFVSSGGNNLLSGGAGADIFNIITAGTIPSAANTILDFQSGTDLIKIQGLGAGFGFDNLTRTGNDIAIGSSVIATLTGVDTSTLTASNFQFS